MTQIEQQSISTDNVTFEVVFTNSVIDNITLEANLELIIGYFCTDQASLVAPIKDVSIA
jgi:hypothetical protein